MLLMCVEYVYMEPACTCTYVYTCTCTVTHSLTHSLTHDAWDLGLGESVVVARVGNSQADSLLGCRGFQLGGGGRFGYLNYHEGFLIHFQSALH